MKIKIRAILKCKSIHPLKCKSILNMKTPFKPRQFDRNSLCNLYKVNLIIHLFPRSYRILSTTPPMLPKTRLNIFKRTTKHFVIFVYSFITSSFCRKFRPISKKRKFSDFAAMSRFIAQLGHFSADLAEISHGDS